MLYRLNSFTFFKKKMDSSRKSVFKKLLFSFIAVFLVPLIIGIILFYRIELIMINDAKKVNAAMLEQVRQIMDNRFKEVEQLSLQISSTPELDDLLNHSIDSNYQYVEFVKELSRYQITSTFINEYFVYLHAPEVVLSPEMKADSRLFFNQVLRYKDLTDLKLVNNRLLNVPYKQYFPIEKAVSNFKEKDIITFVQSLFGDMGELKGSILILIDEHQIRELIQQIEGIDKGFVYIINENNEIIMSTADDENYSPSLKTIVPNDDDFLDYTVDAEGMITSSTKSLQNDWTYVSVVPENVVLAQVNTAKTWALVLVVFSLIVGVIACYYLASRNYKPIQKIVQTILKTNKNAKSNYINEMEFINYTLESTFDQQEQLNKVITQQKPVIQKDFISRLARGQVDVSTIRKTDLELMDNQMESNLHRILLVQINDSDSFNEVNKETGLALSRYVVSKLSEELLDQKGYVVEMERDQIILLLNDENEAEQGELSSFISELKNKVEQEFQLTVTIAVSQSHKGMEGIAKCFTETKKALDYQIVKGQNSIIYFNELNNANDHSYDLPMETQLKLFNYTKVGDVKKVRNCLDKIFSDILEKDSLTPELSRFLSYDLLSTWFKVLRQLCEEDRQQIIKQKNPFEIISSCYSVNQMQNYIVDLFTVLCEKVSANQIDRKQQLYQDLIGYIEENYRNNTFSLQSMADHFGMNASYLSSFFKKSGQVNISEYMTQLRLNESKNLLTNTQLTIAEVAEKVGYTNSVGLIRVFKKLEGVSPGKYRDMLQ